MKLKWKRTNAEKRRVFGSEFSNFNSISIWIIEPHLETEESECFKSERNKENEPASNQFLELSQRNGEFQDEKELPRLLACWKFGLQHGGTVLNKKGLSALFLLRKRV